MTTKKILLSLLLVLFCHIAFAQKTDYKSYAVYLMSFIKYSEWSAAPETKQEVKVAFWGKTKVQQEFENMAKSQQALGKKITVRQIDKLKDNEIIHLLFVADNKSSTIRAVNEAFKQKNVLIIAERDGLAQKGASVHFTISDEDDLGFEVNTKELDNQRIKIAQRLLQLGKKL